jgi:hypothetical protein
MAVNKGKKNRPRPSYSILSTSTNLTDDGIDKAGIIKYKEAVWMMRLRYPSE